MTYIWNRLGAWVQAWNTTVLQPMLVSKRANTGAATGLTVLLTPWLMKTFGWDQSTALTAMTLVGIVGGLYIHSQGLADMGKEAAKSDAAKQLETGSHEFLLAKLRENPNGAAIIQAWEVWQQMHRTAAAMPMPASKKFDLNLVPVAEPPAAPATAAVGNPGGGIPQPSAPEAAVAILKTSATQVVVPEAPGVVPTPDAAQQLAVLINRGVQADPAVMTKVLTVLNWAHTSQIASILGIPSGQLGTYLPTVAAQGVEEVARVLRPYMVPGNGVGDKLVAFGGLISAFLGQVAKP